VGAVLEAIAADPAWLPFELDPASGRVALLAMSEADYRAAAFLDQRAVKAQYRIEWTSLDELAEHVPASARRDAQYIFHIGNVGSTLVSRLLGELPQVFALREPLVLRTFAETQFAPARFDLLCALLSRTFRADQRAIVKATSFTSEIAARLVPEASNALFLFATPEHYLENILAGQNSWRTLEALSPSRLRRLQSRCPGLDLDIGSAGDAVRAALGWACEMTALEEAASLLGDRVLWMDFDRFLVAPAAAMRRIATHFGIELGDEGALALVQGGLMRRYSKAMEFEYSPALRREILAQSRLDHARAIDSALAWLEGLAQTFPAVAQAMGRAREQQ
jgi:hypothetical protein